MRDRLLLKGLCSGGSCLIRDSISETVQDRDVVARQAIRKSYVAYRMSPLRVTYNDRECHFWCLKLFCLKCLQKYSMY